MHPDSSLLQSELQFTAARSSGPGGQNVNKVNTKVILRFNVPGSSLLSADEKNVILEKLSGIITKEGDLIVSSQAGRSQLDNKQIARGKLDKLLRKAFEKRTVRRPTQKSRKAKEKRLQRKKRDSEKKQWRRKLS